MQRRVTVRGIAVLDGKILCARLKPYRSADAQEYWSTPGGGLDPGEALVPCLEREMVEEAGIAPDVGNLLYVQQFAHNGIEQLEFFFHILNAADYQHIDLSKTTHGSTEIDQIAFIDPTQHFVLPKFLTAISFKDLNPDQPTQVFNYL